MDPAATSQVTQVEVESDGPGCLVVRWDLHRDGDGAVDIAVGPTPAAVDHTHALGVPAGERSARLTGLSSGRHYVSIRPRHSDAAVVAAERRVPFEGVVNFRDLGGYRTGSGGRTSWGQVFRSDALHQLTADDLPAFQRLGVRMVYDLRRDDEREQMPNPVDSRQVAILSGLSAQERPDWSGLQQAIDGERRLYESYLGMLATSAPMFGQVLSGMADPDGVPAVFHCAGGKDRTGMTAALLLSWLGVERATVLDDYVMTGLWRTVELEQETFEEMLAAGISRDAAIALLGTPRWVMAEALAVLDEEYGGIEAYLRGPAAMDGETLDALRQRLVSSTS
jgi:protein-tyrosine phosphatase